MAWACGLGVFELQTPCGPAWGHDGDIFGYRTFAITSPDASRQLVISLNSDQILSQQTSIDLDAAIQAGFCGQAAPAGQAAPQPPSYGAMPALP
jgi:D-alanyl-D-alanine carboxypeptidase